MAFNETETGRVKTNLNQSWINLVVVTTDLDLYFHHVQSVKGPINEVITSFEGKV